MSSEIHVMIDLETMSTESNASIASIGAVKFSVDEGVLDTFYCTVDVADCKKHGLHISADTVKWWSKQPKEVLEMLRKDNLSLKEALTKFSVWYGSTQYQTWACGSDFDNVIMENAYKAVEMRRPWNVWKNRCYRTMREMIKLPEDERQGTYHNALDDALHQTRHLLKIFRS
jgi:inhibitor of KinA sporulation pathway (predicted exonuclease)